MQIWSKIEEKFAHILVLKDQDIYRLKVTGMSITFKRKVAGVLEALQQGKAPTDVGAKSVEHVDARTIGKAIVSPSNGSLTLFSKGDTAKTLKFTSEETNADAILAAILAQSGRVFEPAEEEIGVVEALTGPVVTGGIIGVFWWLFNATAHDIAAGTLVEGKGRRQGAQQLWNSAAEALGPKGTMTLGVVLLILFLAWAIKDIVRRPKRTVWLPSSATA